MGLGAIFLGTVFLGTDVNFTVAIELLGLFFVILSMTTNIQYDYIFVKISILTHYLYTSRRSVYLYMGFIYFLTSAHGKTYIGQTKRPIEARFEEHQKPSQCIAISRAIQKYGWETFEKRWYYVPDEELNDYEELMVDAYGTLVPGGYNLRGGGGGGKMSIITKQKISEAHLGKTHTVAAKQKISEAQTGEKNHCYGKTRTADTKKKISEAQVGEKCYWYGKTFTPGHKQNLSMSMRGAKNYKSKKVYQYDIGGHLIQSFDSTGEAARSLGKTDGGLIRHCANGKYKTAYGFRWTYVKFY
ncbi:hypothetical protein ATCV1_Z378L [Acanthocystis turfacea chlorella virus 1]|uniref:Uncharacterized protein Z378L n=1 Tax=Chlorovirus heliozoae TaxID=322019 RepID=A7K8Y8_9PHYC|nr:hypothetical protein ATCV1_Z378L [Acanthocystis turfacea chlorella virus 1]ABT16512.1 hypothetical protein ATCV1_Z378L [Acanthocystis turfacea chlorella virus 1]